MMHISIPKPCHEDWDKMLPNEQGRHCNVCCKTVVDFSSMNDDEVKYFFINKKKEESVCGRFKKEQLQNIKIELPYNIYAVSMPLWKRFLTACLLAFSSMLFSCDARIGDNNTQGEPIPFVMAEDNSQFKLPPPPRPVMLGATMIQMDTATKPGCSILTGDTIYVESISKGEIGLAVIENVDPEVTLPVPPPIKQADAPETILVGKVAIDTNKIIKPNEVDTVRTNKKQGDCGNEFINL